MKEERLDVNEGTELGIEETGKFKERKTIDKNKTTR
jgi:hypothetical protein